MVGTLLFIFSVLFLLAGLSLLRWSTEIKDYLLEVKGMVFKERGPLPKNKSKKK